MWSLCLVWNIFGFISNYDDIWYICTNFIIWFFGYIQETYWHSNMGKPIFMFSLRFKILLYSKSSNCIYGDYKNSRKLTPIYTIHLRLEHHILLILLIPWRLMDGPKLYFIHPRLRTFQHKRIVRHFYSAINEVDVHYIL